MASATCGAWEIPCETPARYTNAPPATINAISKSAPKIRKRLRDIFTSSGNLFYKSTVSSDCVKIVDEPDRDCGECVNELLDLSHCEDDFSLSVTNPQVAHGFRNIF